MLSSVMEKRLVTAPPLEPVSLADVKLHCRIDNDSEDPLLGWLITAARTHVENECGAALIAQSWEVTLDAWPHTLFLPHAPVVEISSVTYTDSDGLVATLPAGAYTVRTGVCPARLQFDWAALPGVTLADVGGVVVRYVAGYGSVAASVPTPIRQAMLLLIGHWYAHREAVSAGDAGPMAIAVDALLGPYRMHWMGPWVV